LGPLPKYVDFINSVTFAPNFVCFVVSIVSGEGAYLTDCDDRQMLDLSMGFGAMLVGHLNPYVVKELTRALGQGTLFVTPSPIARDAAERICERFRIDQVRFTNSGTEATMCAVRLARVCTGKLGVLKLEGGYHGSYDPFSVSCKPPLAEAGPPTCPTPHEDVAGLVTGDVFVVPYNDLQCLETQLEANHDKIACFILEPVMQNVALVLPETGYLEGVRELCDHYNVILIFDEVKTGLTAGPVGAAIRLNVIPDLICLAKSIGGGVPVGAFGGKRQYMDAITDGRFPHAGTFNGNPLAMAGIRAVDIVCTAEALGRAEDLNRQIIERMKDICIEYKLPAQVVGFGVKGCLTWATKPVRNYRDYKETNFEVAELHWLWMVNRNIITPPGLDEQWLISLAHTQKEIDMLVEDFLLFAQALRGDGRSTPVMG
jgi:glutamate-1-semialdehyde 2,1-aminomutase